MLFNNSSLAKYLFCVCFIWLCTGNIGTSARSLQYVRHLSAKKQSGFIENKGQLSDIKGNPQSEIKYYCNRGNVFLSVKKDMISFEFRQGEQINDNQEIAPLKGLSGLKNTPTKVKASRIDLVLLNANPDATLVPAGLNEYHTNNYQAGASVGDSPKLIEARCFNTIIYKNIYPNIDLKLSCRSKGIEYSFVVNPGGDIYDIRMQWNGLDSLKTGVEMNEITYENRIGYINESGLQATSQTGQIIGCNYTVTENIIGFQVDSYDKNKTLVIDPDLEWGTYLGGPDEDEIWGMDIDHKNKVIVTGRTFSPDKIATLNGYDTTYSDSGEGFVAKFADSGQVVWATYFGGNGQSFCNAVSTDKSNNIFVVGGSSSKKGLATSGAYQTSGDGFLAKLDTSGHLVWGTFYGGNTSSNINVVKTDSNGNVCIGGVTLDRTNIATSGAYITKYNSAGFMGFIARFSGSGGMLWSTYFGGTRDDEVHGMCTDAGGDIYITGTTLDTIGLATKGSFQSRLGGYFDAFLAKFNKSGDLQWSTYFGDTGIESGNALAIDTLGEVYMFGNTNSGKGIATNDAYQSTFGGQSGNSQPLGDAFLAEFTPVGTRVWSTYFGGSGNESATAICYNPYGKIDIAGYTNSTSGISTISGYQKIYQGGGADAYLAEFSLNGNLLSGSYFGGNSGDYAEAAAADPYGNAFIAGYTSSISKIATSGSYQSAIQGGDDGFIAKFDLKFRNDAGLKSFTGFNNAICSGQYPIKVILKNFGSIELDSAYINWTVNGKIQHPFYWTGNLDPDQITTVLLANDSFIGGVDTIKAWTSLPNGSIDSFPANDSAKIILTVYPRPLARTIRDTTICPGVQIAIGDSSKAGHYYLWSSNPGGFSSTLSNPVVQPKDSLTEYYLTETNTIPGCSKTDSVLIQVAKIPKINAGGNHSICFGDSITIGSLPFDSNADYSWSNLPGKTFRDPRIIIKPNATATYYLSGAYIPVSAHSCYNRDSAIITVIPLPAAFTGTNKSICIGSFTQLGGKSVPGNKYQWTSSPAGFISTISDPTVNPKTKTTYILSETTPTGCSKTDSITVIVNQNPKADAGPNKIVCRGDTVSIGLKNSLTGYLYSWKSTHLNNYPSTSRINIRPDTTGWYTLTETDSVTGCSGKDSTLVIVIPVPQPKIGGPTELCTNKLPVEFGTSIDSGAKYTWTVKGGKIISGQGPDSIYFNPDSSLSMIRLTEKDLNGCQNKDSINVFTSSPPDASWKLLSDSPVSVFKAIDTTGQYYHWNFGDGSTGSNILEKHKYPFLKDSTVDVSLTVATAFGCSATYDSVIRIRYIPNPQFYIEVFPTPFSQNTNIKISLEQNSHIQILAYDDIGRLVGTLVDTRQNAGITQYKFDANHYSMAYGLYYLRIMVNGVPYVRPVVRAE